MNTRQLLAVLALLCGGAAHAEPSRLTPFAEGEAFDRESGTLLYRELHDCASDLRHCTVRYKDTEGELIALKQLDYGRDMTAPSLVMTDYRRDREIRIPFTEESGLFVVDAGFDNFVRAQWDTLADGQPVTFRFRGVGFDSPVSMKIGVDDGRDCNPENLCLAVNIDSWLLSSFIDPIRLSYTRNDRRLLRYSGISNLRDESGEALYVDIHYVYPATPAPQGDDVAYNLATEPGR